MIHIITDSMSDIPQSYGKENRVTVLPQKILFGDETFLDGITIDTATFYKKMATAVELPKTSQASPEDYYSAMKKALDNHMDVLVITGSSGLSGCYQSALIAKDMLAPAPKVHIVDSLSASLGEAFLVHEAVRLRSQGLVVEEIVLALEALKEKQQLFGSVSDLKYLVMGGRLSALGGKAGSILKIRPILGVENGLIGVKSLVRGKKKMLEWFSGQLQKGNINFDYPVYFAGANADAALGELKTYLEQQGYMFPNAHIMNIGPIIGAHVGPGTIIILWIEK